MGQAGAVDVNVASGLAQTAATGVSIGGTAAGVGAASVGLSAAGAAAVRGLNLVGTQGLALSHLQALGSAAKNLSIQTALASNQTIG